MGRLVTQNFLHSEGFLDSLIYTKSDFLSKKVFQMTEERSTKVLTDEVAKSVIEYQGNSIDSVDLEIFEDLLMSDE